MKKVIGLILAVAMCFSVMTVPAFAAETPNYYGIYHTAFMGGGPWDQASTADQIQYGLYDLNNDGVLELIITNGDARVTQGYYVYTIKDNAPAYLGWAQAAPIFTYICPDGGLLIADQYLGYTYVSRLQVVNDKIINTHLIFVDDNNGAPGGKGVPVYGDKDNGLSSDDAKALLQKWFPNADPNNYVVSSSDMVQVNFDAFTGFKSLQTVPENDDSLLNAASAVTAVPASSTVLIDGKEVAFDAYNIDGNNYFKLRDLAFVLNGTKKQFNIEVDASGPYLVIYMTSGTAYTVAGGEMTGKSSGNKTGNPTGDQFVIDGKGVTLTAYKIDGNNYFKLRDIGQAFNFGVDWDGNSNTIVIDTNKSYDAPNSDTPSGTGGQTAGQITAEEALASFAGTYTPYPDVSASYGGGSQWQDIVLDKNGIITGGGTDWYHLSSSGAKPASITRAEDGSIVITITDNESYTIYPAGVAPGMYNGAYNNNVVNIRYLMYDGGVMDIMYYKSGN